MNTPSLRLLSAVGLLAACSNTNRTMVYGDGGDGGESPAPGGKALVGGATSRAGAASEGGALNRAGAENGGGIAVAAAGTSNTGGTTVVAASAGGSAIGVAGTAAVGGTTISVAGAVSVGGTTAGVGGSVATGGTPNGAAGATTHDGGTAGTAGIVGVAGMAGAPEFCAAKPVGAVCGKPGSAATCQSDFCIAPGDILGTSTVELGAATASSTYDDDCPSGHFLVGFEAGIKDGAGTRALAGFAGLCAPISLSAKPDGGYTLTVDSSTLVRIPVTGGRGAAASYEKAPSQFLCEAGSVVTALKGIAANGQVVGLAASCSTPAVGFASNTSVEFGLQLTPVADTAAQQSSVLVGDLTTTVDCPTGSVPRGIHILAGDAVDGLALRCAAPPFPLPTSTEGVGDLGGAARLDACPEGQVMTGIVASVGSAGSNQANRITRWTTRCGVVSLDPSSSKVTIAGDTAVPATLQRGSFSPVTALPPIQCPTDQVVVGFQGTATGRPAQIALRCAPLSVGEISDQWVGLVPGAITTLDLVGAVAGANPFGPFDCPSGTVSVGTSNRSGDVINRAALLCAELAVKP